MFDRPENQAPPHKSPVAAFFVHSIYFMIGRLAVASLTKRNEHTLYYRFRFYSVFFVRFFFFRLRERRTHLNASIWEYRILVDGIKIRERNSLADGCALAFGHHKHTQHII